MEEAVEQSRGWRERIRPILRGGVPLVALALIAYLPALSAGFVWDDPDYVVNNANLRSLSGLWYTWFVPASLPQYYPLVHTTFWIEYQLWGLSPFGYHLVNVLLHATGAVLLWRLLRMLDVPGAWLAAVIFALHPVHVESVAWITERKNVLSGALYLGAFIAYLKSGALADGKRHVDWYIAALALFVLALLSKTVTASLPAAILLVVWWKRGRIAWRDVLPLVPLFLLGLGFSIVTVYLERTLVGAEGTEWHYSIVERVLIAGRACWFYAGKLLVPLNLAFIYPQWRIDPAAWWQWAFPIAAVLLVVALFAMRHRIGRGPLVAVLFFGGTLVPALGFVNVYPMRYSFVADHFQYHASTGIIALVAAVFARARVEKVAAPILIVALGTLTFRQTFIYDNTLTLWRDTLEKNPDGWMVHLNMAHALREAGDVARAGEHYARAYQLAPQVPDTGWNYGAWLDRVHRDDQAMAVLDEVVERWPTFARPYVTRGSIYRERGDLDAARRELLRAIELLPDYPEAHVELGLLAEQQGDVERALEHYRTAASQRLDYAEPHRLIANLLRQRGDLAGAAQHYAQAVAARPDWAEAYVDLGATLLEARRPAEALPAFEAALAIDPDLVQAQRGLIDARMRVQLERVAAPAGGP